MSVLLCFYFFITFNRKYRENNVSYTGCVRGELATTHSCVCNFKAIQNNSDNFYSKMKINKTLFYPHPHKFTRFYIHPKKYYERKERTTTKKTETWKFTQNIRHFPIVFHILNFFFILLFFYYIHRIHACLSVHFKRTDASTR